MIHGAPVKNHGPKIPSLTFLNFSLFQNPAGRDVTQSQQIFETTVKNVKSKFPLEIEQTQIVGDEDHKLKTHS